MRSVTVGKTVAPPALKQGRGIAEQKDLRWMGACAGLLESVVHEGSRHIANQFADIRQVSRYNLDG